MTAAGHRSAGARRVDGLDAVAALRHGRRVARLSQRDLARRAGVSQSLVARIEARRVDPPVGVMQRLLGFCGLRWELRLVVAGDTAARVGRRREDVTDAADRRTRALSDRRLAEHATARDTADRLAGGLVTVRGRRKLVRAARLSERAVQAAAYAASVEAEDAIASGWSDQEAQWASRQFDRYAAHCRQTLADRLPARAKSGRLRDVLEALAGTWPWPPAALTGATARAVWAPAGGRCAATSVVHLAPIGRDESEALRFLTALGAHRRANSALFDLDDLVVRLWPGPALSVSLVRWRPGGPARALAVARPETPDGREPDRHAVRAVLEWAGRDARGRRRAPYHEALATTRVSWWLGSPGSTAKWGDAQGKIAT